MVNNRAVVVAAESVKHSTFSTFLRVQHRVVLLSQRVISSETNVNLCNKEKQLIVVKNNTNCAVCCRPTEREKMERLLRRKLQEIMMQKDLESVTCKEVRATAGPCWSRSLRPVLLQPSAFNPPQIRTELEMQMVCDLAEFKKFIGNEMLVILGQMDSPTEVFEHVYLVRESTLSVPELLHGCSFYWTEC